MKILRAGRRDQVREEVKMGVEELLKERDQCEGWDWV